MRIIVLGYIVRGPMGGMVASNVQYLTGLARLGHDIYFLEYGQAWDCCYDPRQQKKTTDPAYGLSFIDTLLKPFGLDDRWGYYDPNQAIWHGPLASRINDVIADAELVLNLCGLNDLVDGLQDVPIRVLVEEDPVFVQVKHLNDPNSKAKAMLHNRFFTFASNWGKPNCTVPDDGIAWCPTVPPVVVEHWPVVEQTTPASHYTTVLQWRSYPPVTYAGVDYHAKDQAFTPYCGLPARVDAGLEMAIAGTGQETAEELTEKGWHIIDPAPISVSLPAYRDYIAHSRGEFSIAKHGYVISRSGWFSERTACYLACGRPAIVQNTGFSDWLPNDSAVGAFNTPDEAVEHIQRIESDYERYRREARDLAAAYFGSDAVLSRLLEEVNRPHA